MCVCVRVRRRDRAAEVLIRTSSGEDSGRRVQGRGMGGGLESGRRRRRQGWGRGAQSVPLQPGNGDAGGGWQLAGEVQAGDKRAGSGATAAGD